jgi:hypothetical protein
MRDEWVRVVTDLIDQIKGWIDESNSDGLLTCQKTEGLVSEEGLGRYKVPLLVIELDGEQVFISPRGRKVLAFIRQSPTGAEVRAQGRVDVTNHRVTFSLLRAPEGDTNPWYLYDDLTGVSRPLSRDTLEAILVSLLK